MPLTSEFKIIFNETVSVSSVVQSEELSVSILTVFSSQSNVKSKCLYLEWKEMPINLCFSPLQLSWVWMRMSRQPRAPRWAFTRSPLRASSWPRLNAFTPQRAQSFSGRTQLLNTWKRWGSNMQGCSCTGRWWVGALESTTNQQFWH